LGLRSQPEGGHYDSHRDRLRRPGPGPCRGRAGAVRADNGLGRHAARRRAPAGTAQFRQFPAGLLIEVEITGLPPGEHGIHIHETGACTPDFDAAGEHFAPQGNGHGFAATATPHPGDLPNLVVGADGVGAAHFLNQRATLSEGETAILDDDGAALIVHEGTDSYGETAGAGGRIACGTVEPAG
jgi:Cu-Zn family superoxide dismutase